MSTPPDDHISLESQIFSHFCTLTELDKKNSSQEGSHQQKKDSSVRAAPEQVDQDHMFYKMHAVCTKSFPKQVDIVDLRAETNVISKLGREQGSAFRKSSESQTDAAEVNKKSILSDSMSRSFLSSIPGC